MSSEISFYKCLFINLLLCPESDWLVNWNRTTKHFSYLLVCAWVKIYKLVLFSCNPLTISTLVRDNNGTDVKTALENTQINFPSPGCTLYPELTNVFPQDIFGDVQSALKSEKLKKLNVSSFDFQINYWAIINIAGALEDNSTGINSFGQS